MGHQQHPNIIIAPSDVHGRGVFTSKTIYEGELIEICPVLVLPEKDIKLIHETALHDYYFLWGEEQNYCAIVLGYGSIYNHSYIPNAEYYPNYEDASLTIYCLKNIPAGTEILFNYNGNPDNQSPIWFGDKED